MKRRMAGGGESAAPWLGSCRLDLPSVSACIYVSTLLVIFGRPDNQPVMAAPVAGEPPKTLLGKSPAGAPFQTLLGKSQAGESSETLLGPSPRRGSVRTFRRHSAGRLPGRADRQPPCPGRCARTGGQDPHIFEPTPRQVIALSQARLFFRVGMPFEAADRTYYRGACAFYGRRHGGRRCPSGVKPRLHGRTRRGRRCPRRRRRWEPSPYLASPRLLKIMAANVAAALRQIDPQHASRLPANLNTLHAELDALDRRIDQSLAPFQGQAF